MERADGGEIALVSVRREAKPPLEKRSGSRGGLHHGQTRAA